MKNFNNIEGKLKYCQRVDNKIKQKVIKTCYFDSNKKKYKKSESVSYFAFY